MKRISLWVMSTLSILVMLFSYHTSTEAVAAKAPTTVAVSQEGSSASSNSGASQTTTSGGANGTGNSSSSSSSSSSATSSTSSASKTYTGNAVTMRYGDVQVQIAVSNGKITKATTLTYPTDNPRDVEINDSAVPVLNSEAVTNSSSSIDMVSGATYTSEAYIESLQNAIDQAGI